MQSILFGLLLSLASTTTVSIPHQIGPVASTTDLVKTDEHIASLLPALVPICACESTGSKDGKPRHYDENGNVLRGKINPLDVGACQINLHYHQATAEKIGLDLMKEEDNITYANYLYKIQGARPWKWSASCHGDNSD